MQAYTRKLTTSVVLLSFIVAPLLANICLAQVTKHFTLPNRLQDFCTLALSIIVEAMPFVILGALVAGLVHIFIRQQTMLKLLPKQPTLRRMVLSLLGVIFPVCECGNVPVARSLLAKGLSTAESVTFLLAAPILNPLTFITTWEAFRFDHSMVVIRMLGGFIIANFIGWLIHHHPDQKTLLQPSAVTYNKKMADEDEQPTDWRHKKEHFISIFTHELWVMLSMLSIGALVAAASQSFIPRHILLAVGSQPVLSVLAMLALAFVISLCANVDAFFALAYSNTFTFGALASFLVFGPMIDIKVLALMKTTFKIRTLGLITGLCLIMSLLLGLVVNYAF